MFALHIGDILCLGKTAPIQCPVQVEGKDKRSAKIVYGPGNQSTLLSDVFESLVRTAPRIECFPSQLTTELVTGHNF